MTINKVQEDGKFTLVIEGRLDTTTAPQLQEVLIPTLDESKDVTLDFKGLAYVSSAGLRVLLMGQKQAKKTGGAMKLQNVSEEVMEVLEMTGFADMLTIL